MQSAAEFLDSAADFLFLSDFENISADCGNEKKPL